MSSKLAVLGLGAFLLGTTILLASISILAIPTFIAGTIGVAVMASGTILLGIAEYKKNKINNVQKTTPKEKSKEATKANTPSFKTDTVTIKATNLCNAKCENNKKSLSGIKTNKTNHSSNQHKLPNIYPTKNNTSTYRTS